MNWMQFRRKIQNIGIEMTYLELMVEYGFIQTNTDLKDFQIDAEKLLELNKKIAILYTEKKQLIKQFKGLNPTDVRKSINKQRIMLSREIRKKKKLEKQNKIILKRNERKKFLSEHIEHVGKNYSGSLKHDNYRNDLLESNGLPIILDENDLCLKLGINLKQLKWITYHRDASKISHYHTFEIPKKTGGIRQISAPKKKIKNAQQWIHDNILQKFEFSINAHGFIKGKSIITNANNHLNSDFIINIDLHEFFPTISFKRVPGLFKSLGYSSFISTLLALICTESDRKLIDLDGEKYYVAVSTRHLPQGACTSPALSNMICKRLDKRLNSLCSKNEIKYSRYADDMTFSFNDRKKIGLVFAVVKKIVKEEGFTLNDKKTRIFTKSNRQEVTGIVTNEKINVPRKWVNQLRLEVYQFNKAKLQKVEPPVPLTVLQGKIAYLQMVNKVKADKLRTMLTL